MKLKSIKVAAAAVASAVGAAALVLPATPASATNPPYSGCPGWSLCLYKDGNGGGSKAILTPPAAGGHTASVTLYSTHFLNGELANNQVTSWLNNSNCQVEMWDDPESDYPFLVDIAPRNNWGRTNDLSGQYGNDRISGVRFYCP